MENIMYYKRSLNIGICGIVIIFTLLCIATKPSMADSIGIPPDYQYKNANIAEKYSLLLNWGQISLAKKVLYDNKSKLSEFSQFQLEQMLIQHLKFRSLYQSILEQKNGFMLIKDNYAFSKSFRSEFTSFNEYEEKYSKSLLEFMELANPYIEDETYAKVIGENFRSNPVFGYILLEYVTNNRIDLIKEWTDVEDLTASLNSSYRLVENQPKKPEEIYVKDNNKIIERIFNIFSSDNSKKVAPQSNTEKSTTFTIDVQASERKQGELIEKIRRARTLREVELLIDSIDIPSSTNNIWDKRIYGFYINEIFLALSKRYQWVDKFEPSFSKEEYEHLIIGFIKDFKFYINPADEFNFFDGIRSIAKTDPDLINDIYFELDVAHFECTPKKIADFFKEYNVVKYWPTNEENEIIKAVDTDTITGMNYILKHCFDCLIYGGYSTYQDQECVNVNLIPVITWFKALRKLLT
jgi:hypothetical protein